MDRQAGPRSEILTVDTTPHDPHVVDTIPDPDPPKDFRLLAMPNYEKPAPAISLSWSPVRLATAYEVYVNNSSAGTSAMDPTRSGLMMGDTLVATVPQPADPKAVITHSIDDPAPDTAYVIKVRSARTATLEPGFDETKTSAFTPEVRTRTGVRKPAA
ncbi:hypothetical protein ACGFYQ_41385 [Streptomyces sp. NPDC048258]|uniref:hypothetical protein n=1 Tax=Streptomyces sp. NPDC048258 TaxID=3365527 RepID=UPI003715512D